MNLFINSIQGKLTILLGLLIIFFSLLENISFYAILLQAFGIFIIARNIDCYIYGKCVLGAWMGLMIPTSVFLIMLMSKLSYFNDTKKQIIKLLKYFNKMNSSRCDLFKKINIKNIKNNKTLKNNILKNTSQI